MDNQSISLTVTIELAERSAAKATGWQWAKGVTLFPEAKCPYCKRIIRSRAVWRIDNNKLMGQAVPVAGRELKLGTPHHPHSEDNGTICFGDAFAPAQALFGSLNPTSTYFEMSEWLQGELWGHECDELLEVIASRDSFLCYGCEERFDREDYSPYYYNDNYYCESCFLDTAFSCYNCGEVYSLESKLVGPRGHSFCSDCFEDKCFNCSECGVAEYQGNKCGEGLCQSCWEKVAVVCPVCSGKYVGDECDSGDCCSKCHRLIHYGDCLPPDDIKTCATCSVEFNFDLTGTSCDADCGRFYCATHSEGDCTHG